VSSQPVSTGSTRKLNIPLTEDNPVGRVLAQILQKQGHTVTSAKNGKEAVELWEQNQPRQFDRSGDLTGAEGLVCLLEEQVGELNRVLARNIEGVHQPH
jgi:CheY-like chemotaxis protein